LRKLEIAAAIEKAIAGRAERAELTADLAATISSFLKFWPSKETVRRVGIERCQSRIEAEPRPAVGTEDRIRLAHIDVDVRVVLRW
jgi:hypothetical protein